MKLMNIAIGKKMNSENQLNRSIIIWWN